MFDPVQGKGMPANVALQIEAAILGHKFLPGQKLPSERTLQHLFKTGRGVIREALRELRQKGLIETRRGGKGGTYVKQVGAFDASQPLALLIKQQEIDIDMLIEFRESIDRTITLLAIARGEARESKALVDRVAELESIEGYDDFSLQQIGEVDRDLNLMLARMTKNPIFDWIMRTIQISFGSYDHILYEDAYYRDKTIKNWRETAAAIDDRQPLKALSFIGYHYVMLNRRIREVRAKQPAGHAEAPPC